jgi:hypothetical protein
MDDDALATIQRIAAGIDAMYAELEMQDAGCKRQDADGDVQEPGRNASSDSVVGAASRGASGGAGWRALAGEDRPARVVAQADVGR